MKKAAERFGELDLIEEIRRSSVRRNSSVALGIGDDCAILKVPKNCEVIVTTDFSIEGRHFRRDWHSPESIGHRCLARGLSDIAAMGGKPLAAFLSLALPKDLIETKSGRNWIRRFFAGLSSLGDRFGVSLAGGDTAESPDGLVLADIVLTGSVPKGKALRRSGARAGNLLYCTGALGGAAAGLEALMAGKKIRGKMSRHLFPEPRLAVGAALLQRGLATACLDMSDGLSTDLAHLCRASRVSAEVYRAELPVHLTASRLRARELEHAILHGGEDYELLFAAPATVRVPRSIAGVAITQIGKLHHRSVVPMMTLVDSAGRRRALEQGGWEHFSCKD